MLNRSQQKNYRALVAKAWIKFCDVTGADECSKIAHEKWYRNELVKNLGIYTTKEANAGRDYDRLMAHFERMGGDGEYWQIKASQGDEKRMRWIIGKFSHELVLHESYVAGICRKMGMSENLNELTVQQLRKIVAALNLYKERARRGNNSEYFKSNA